MPCWAGAARIEDIPQSLAGKTELHLTGRAESAAPIFGDSQRL